MEIIRFEVGKMKDVDRIRKIVGDIVQHCETLSDDQIQCYKEALNRPELVMNPDNLTYFLENYRDITTDLSIMISKIVTQKVKKDI